MTDFPNSPVTGDTFTANNIEYVYNGIKWSVFAKQYSYKGSSLTSVSNITEIDLSSGNFFELDLSENTEIQFSNPPATGFAQKFYLKLGINSDYIGTIGYDLTIASYDNASFSVATQETSPVGLTFKPDGTKMYIVGTSGDDINEYDLSTAWDVTSATFLQNFSVSAQDTAPYDVFFKPDGTKMYVAGDTGADINEYNLSTPWDVTSASFLQNFSVATQDSDPSSLFFKPDGTKMYMHGQQRRRVNEYDLSTPWDVTSASFLQIYSVSIIQENFSHGITFKPDGTKMYITGSSGDDVNEYDLSPAWDISSATYLQVFSVAAQAARPNGLFFKPDGTKMYIVGLQNRAVYQYSTGYIADTPVTWPTSVVWESGSAPTLPELNQTDLLEFYTSDNGTTYYAKLAEDNIS